MHRYEVPRSGRLFSGGVKTTMVLSMGEKRGKSAVKQGGRGDTVRCFQCVIHQESTLWMCVSCTQSCLWSQSRAERESPLPLLITCFCKLITNHCDFFECNYKGLMERCKKTVNGFKKWSKYIYTFFLLESTVTVRPNVSPGNIS